MLGKYLNPQNDFAFKRLFGVEKNKDILMELLNCVLNRQLHQRVVEVTFLPPVLDPEIFSKKQSIVDVLCRDQDGCQYVIEMQVAPERGFEERAQYYAFKAFVSQMNVGERYEDLKEVIFLAFTNFSIFPHKKSYKSEHIILDRDTHERNLDKLSFTFVDLPKFDAQRPKELSQLTLEEKFYYFLCHAAEIKPEELKKLIGGDKIIKKAFKELDHFYWTEEEMRTYEAVLKRDRDHAAILGAAMDKGIQKGIEGKEEGKIEGIKKGMEKGIKKGKEEMILGLHKHGVALDVIVKSSGLSKEVVESILAKR